MAVETASWVTQLVDTNPEEDDPVGFGDDHLRMLKTVLKNSFPSTSTTAIVPDVSGQSGKILTNDGTDTSWGTAGDPPDDSISTIKIQDDAVTAAKLANSINTEITANTAKVTNATHTGDVTGATALTIASGAVDLAMLSATGTASSSTVLHGDNTWAEVSGGTSWQAVQTTSFTAVAGNGYPINTTSGVITITLPASASVGDTIEVADYAGTWQTNPVTINSNSLNFMGGTGNRNLKLERLSTRIVYVDVTQGWLTVSAANEGTTMFPTYSIEYDVVAGGGGNAVGQGGQREGGSGAGGFLTSTFTGTPAIQYTITVGAGGSGHAVGSNSTISGTGLTTITSFGGGFGGNYDYMVGAAGGSGGGNWYNTAAGGAGTAGQGNNGSPSGGTSGWTGGGGGGKGGAGSVNSTKGVGGAGAVSTITGDTYAHGGDGNRYSGHNDNTAGAVNTGYGGNGAGSGGSGIVNLKMLTIDYTGATTGSPTVSTDGDYTELKFTGSGSYTA